jgi:hypothetical protein
MSFAMMRQFRCRLAKINEVYSLVNHEFPHIIF